MPSRRDRQRTTSDPLLHTKLVPPRLTAGLLSRPALLARLDESMVSKLTLISAPAGYGKTTLVAQWLATRRELAIWVSLDAGDDDPVRFWTFLITVCRSLAPSLGKSALAALRTAPQAAFEAVLTSFINELATLPAPGIFVLEDYHVIASPQIHQTVAFLLDHLPDTLHLVLMTRTEPPIRLPHLRARHEMVEINAADLRFTREETSAFLEQNLRVSLKPETIARLDAQTEGWVAGLRFVTLAAEGKNNPSAIEQFLVSHSASGGQRHVIEYLTAEVLTGQPEPLQEFLLQTSILDRLSASLCDAVTARNDSDRLLAQLERSNLFLLPLGEVGGQAWYRYHTLFGEALRRSAAERFGEEQVHVLYGRASEWYEAHSLRNEAVETALAAQQPSRAALLIEQSLDWRGQHELNTFRRWIEQLPQKVFEAHPTLCFEYALALLFTSDRYAASTAAQLEAPLRAAEETWRREDNHPALGQALGLRAMVSLWQGDLARAFTLVHESVPLLSEDDAFWRSSDLLIVGIEESLAGRIDAAQNVLIEARALAGAAQSIQGQLAATGLLADAYVRQGEFDQALQLYEQVQGEAIGGEDMLDDQGSAALGIGTIAYERNDLDAAEREATRALELGVRRSNESLAVDAELVLARVLHARGKSLEAQGQLRAAIAQTRQPLLVQKVLAYQARLALAADDLDGVHRWYAAAAQRNHDLPDTLREQRDLMVARVLMADEKPEAALELLERWRADAREHGRTSSELEILALEALTFAAQPNKPQAYKTLMRALILAHARGYLRVFLDEGDKMQSMISDFRFSIEKQTPRLRAYVFKLLSAFSSEITLPSPKSRVPFEPLSPQEQRVLHLLAAGMSNPEIARQLVVSTNTIKTQLQSIYRKLNVTSREEARDLARHLNLS